MAGGNAYAYTYDLVGNRTGGTVNGTPTLSQTYDAADQVVGWQYDGAGNLLSDGTNTYAYDPLGRLSSVTAGSTTATYGYNGDGVLASQVAGGVTTRYTLDLTGPLPERVGATTGGVSTWYLRGYGQELARETGGATTWYLADRLGSVRGEYGASGTLTATYAYDPFGQPEGTSVPADYGFTGEPQGGPAGLVQLRARWYQPTSGTFTSRDPASGAPAQPQSLVGYAYAHNDPVNGTDPTGMYYCDRGWPFYQDYARYCFAQRSRLNDPSSTFRSMAGNDDLGALIYLFSDEELPGGAEAPLMIPALTRAVERLEFVLWYTMDPNKLGGQFYETQGEGFHDTGFAQEFQDSPLWGDASDDQIGHFLTAVQLGYTGLPQVPGVPNGLDCLIGHELIPDSRGTRAACTYGTSADGEQRRNLFQQAINADHSRYVSDRDCLLRQIDPTLPETGEQVEWLREHGIDRTGNSLQDLRLSLKGWRFGQEIHSGEINDLFAARLWLIANLAPDGSGTDVLSP